MKKVLFVLCAGSISALALGQATASSSGSAFVVSPFREPTDQLSKRFPPDVIATSKDGKIAYNSRRFCVYPSGDRKSLSIKNCDKPARRLRLTPFRFAPLTPKP